MRKKQLHFLIFFVGLSFNLALGNNENKNKHHDYEQQKNKTPRYDRTKRSLIQDRLLPFGEVIPENIDPNNYLTKYSDSDEFKLKLNNKIEKDLPFWGTRGRRDSSSNEGSVEIIYPETLPKITDQFCEHCSKNPEMLSKFYAYKNRRDEETSPFWGHRGRRMNVLNDDDNSPFWGNRGRRQENEQFWATRGRRQEEEPFWGNRGRREDEPFWRNRGRREESAFWGSRGRRDVIEPFWGNRGRREGTQAYWENRGSRKEDSDSFRGNRGRKKQDLKDSILGAINSVEEDIESLSRLRRGGEQVGTSFWANRGRDSKLKLLFNGSAKSRLQTNTFQYKPRYSKTSKFYEPNTVLDNRMYAEEPHFILVDRSSRSSGEEDPYFITRGKKKLLNLAKAARERRGSIEQIVKSVRNDPYFIARGKKDTIKIGNSTVLRNKLGKAKDLICATIDIIMIKNENNKIKREEDENERDRRTILKKLAAQLQNDPYFVSRGKKSDDLMDIEPLETFINEISEMCH